MSKGLISFIAIACIAAVAVMLIYMKLSANKARKISDEMMEKFKTVDKDLQKTNEKLDSLNKINFDSLIKASK